MFNSAHLLRLPRIEQRSKKVIKSTNYRKLTDLPDIEEISQEKSELLVASIKDITHSIINGYGLSEKYYRNNIDDPNYPDKLLEYAGIMHIHPLGPGTSEVLYMIQGTKSVGILELTDHRHFDRINTPHCEELIAIHGEFIKSHLDTYNSSVFSYYGNMLYNNDNPKKI